MRANLKTILLATGLAFASATLAFLPPLRGSQAPAALETTHRHIAAIGDREGVSVTVYNSNMGLVKDVRRIQLLPGLAELKFSGVAAQIMPQTVHVKSLIDPSLLEILEQNYEYDLLTPQKLLEKFVGEEIMLLSNGIEVPVNKRFLYYGAQHYYQNRYGVPVSNQKVGVYVETANKKENRLGVPLPKGTVRVYKADGDASLQFIGEDRIDHTPKEETVRVKMGDAFDVVAKRKQTEWRKLATGLYEVSFEIKLRNHKETPVTVSVVEPIPGDWEIVQNSHDYEDVEAHTVRFDVPVEKDEEAKLRYRVRVKF